MTHDGHAFFKSKEDCQKTYDFLKGLKIENKKLFYVELNPHDENKLFYQLSFTDELKDKKVCFKSDDKNYPFFKYFDAIVTRSGRHIPIGTVYSESIKFPEHMFNHEFNKYVNNFLAPEKFPIKMQMSVPPKVLDVVSD